jgi:hypothetical protein
VKALPFARLFAVTVLLGCSTPPSDARFTEAVPDRASFPVVAQALVHRCGTLDCHGTQYRNLRLFGNEGLRWSATDMPLQPACTTTPEVDQDFASVVGLEPEVMSRVVAGHGADPALLTLVRKARGTESHKGGTLMSVGDDLDVCITSWLTGQTATAACGRVAPPTYPIVNPASCQPGP